MYNYEEEVKKDIKNAIKNHDDFPTCLFEMEESDWLDELWIDDSVTGNESGSYTMDSETAHKNIFGNEKLLMTALDEFDCDSYTLMEHFTDYEWMDVTIRCWLLTLYLSEVLDELKNQYNYEEGNQDNE